MKDSLQHFFKVPLHPNCIPAYTLNKELWPEERSWLYRLLMGIVV